MRVEGPDYVGPLHAFILAEILNEVHLFKRVLLIRTCLRWLTVIPCQALLLLVVVILTVLGLGVGVSGGVTGLLLRVHGTGCYCCGHRSVLLVGGVGGARRGGRGDGAGC